MKKIFIALSISFTLLTFVTGCDLERHPSSGITLDEDFQTIEDATAHHYGFLTALRSCIYGRTCYLADIQADLWDASVDYGNTSGPVYTWNFVANDDDILAVWSVYYTNINQLNVFLDNVDKIPVKANSTNAKLIQVYKGEAYLLRAYYYHQLVKYYALPYVVMDKTNTRIDNKEKPGLPLTTHYDVEARPFRSNLETTYQLILDDLKEAKTLLTTIGTPGSQVLTADCVTAMEARVHLSMGNWEKAAIAADALITGGKYPLVNTVAELKAVWYKHDPRESLVQLYAATDHGELGSTNSIYLGYNSTKGAYSPLYIPTKWLVDTTQLYRSKDIRRAVYFAEKSMLFTTYSNKLILFNKFPGDSSLYSNPKVTNYQHMPKLFRIAEAHLIKAEALYRSGQDAPALAALEVLRSNRGLEPYSGSNLLQEIKDERTRELLGEGNRLDDLKRWGEDMDRGARGVQNANTVAANSNLKKSAGDNKFVWAIPNREVQNNKNLTNSQNPGW